MNKIDQYEALRDGKTSTGSLAGRAHLRKRFAGIDAQIGRVVGEMADYYHGKEAPPFHVYSDIRANVPEGYTIALSWNAWVIATSKQFDSIRMPVIPDEHNPRSGGLIKESDAPYDFRSMAEAERYAEIAEMELRKELRKLFADGRSLTKQP